jgi:hypothetical protein
MPLYQNSTVDKTKLIIGNYKMEVATYGSTIASTFINLGAGIVNSFNHNVTKYDVQAGNAPDPIEGIAEETFTVEGELIEYDQTKIAFLYSGVATTAGSAASGTISFGGLAEMTDIAVRLTNTRLYTGSGASALSATTTIFIPKATASAGLSFTAKSDNDTDPINVMAFSIEGKIDGTLTAGAQLYTMKKTVGLSA